MEGYVESSLKMLLPNTALKLLFWFASGLIINSENEIIILLRMA